MDTTNVINEVCVVVALSAAFVDLPPSDRVKQFRQDFIHALSSKCTFRHKRYGQMVTTRVHVYRNAHTRELLSVVRHHDTHDSNILFLKGHISLDDLRNKLANDITH